MFGASVLMLSTQSFLNSFFIPYDNTDTDFATESFFGSPQGFLYIALWARVHIYQVSITVSKAEALQQKVLEEPSLRMTVMNYISFFN